MSFWRASMRRLGTVVSLDELSDPDREIADSPVEDRMGRLAGHFRRLTFRDGGREEALIALPRKDVAVDVDDLRYDPQRATIVADLSLGDLNDMPARF